VHAYTQKETQLFVRVQSGLIL